MNRIYNLVIVGIGGQGNLFLAKTLCRTAVTKNLNVVMSEVHGLAQRGGTVITHVRFGNVLSPLIPDREADWIISAELNETLRVANKASSQCVTIASSQPNYPLSSFLGYDFYPSREEVEREIKRVFYKTLFVDLNSIAKTCGHAQAANMVLLGALMAVGGFPFDAEDVLKTIKANCAFWTWLVDKKAFLAGMEAAKEAIISRVS